MQCKGNFRLGIVFDALLEGASQWFLEEGCPVANCFGYLNRPSFFLRAKRGPTVQYHVAGVQLGDSPV